MKGRKQETDSDSDKPIHLQLYPAKAENLNITREIQLVKQLIIF